MEIIILILLAYVLGSVPSALWVGKLFYGTDVRKHGSGNLGATNTFRVLGKTAGLIVTILDILKGTAAVLLPLLPIFNSAEIHPLSTWSCSSHWTYVPYFREVQRRQSRCHFGGRIARL